MNENRQTRTIRNRSDTIGFQELSRDGAHVQVRNARIKVLEP